MTGQSGVHYRLDGTYRLVWSHELGKGPVDRPTGGCKVTLRRGDQEK